MIVRGWFAAALLVAPLALADGVSFQGDVPQTPHTWVKLTPAQARVVAAAPTSDFQGHVVKRAQILLTPEQRARVQRAAGSAPAWVEVASAPVFSLDCTCGAVNIASLSADERRAAVLHGFIDLDALSESAIDGLRRRVDASLSKVGVPDATRMPRFCFEEPRSKPQADIVADTALLEQVLASLTQGGEPGDRAVLLGEGWTKVRVRVARWEPDYFDTPQVLPVLRAEITIGRARDGRRLKWTEDAGAVLEREKNAFVLLPDASSESSLLPRFSVLFFRDGRLRGIGEVGGRVKILEWRESDAAVPGRIYTEGLRSSREACLQRN